MKELFQKFKSRFMELWQKTTVAQKSIIIGAGVLIVLALSFFINSATQPDYVQLFGGLDEQSANSAVQQLKSDKISYKIADGGKTILVPSKNVDEERIKLVSAGVNSDGQVDFSIFDKTQFGETDADKRVKFLRALQGELTRTIEKFPEVANARVHIVTPEPSLFEDQQKDATAAVWLQMKPGKQMNDSEVNGLIKLVSSSVEGLKPQNITVVDTFGNVLSGKYNQNQNDAQTASLSQTQLQLQQQTQDAYQNSIQSMLDRVVGVGQSVVRVKVDLDLDNVVTDKVEHNGNKVIVSQQKDEESNKGTNSTGGVPGTTSNVDNGNTTTYQTTDGSSNTSSDKNSSITNYEVDKVTEHRVANPGSVKRLSVAVVYNGEDQQKQKAIEDAVRAAAGIDTKRGDSISVTSVPFNTKYDDEVKAAMAKDARQQAIFTYGGIGLAIVALGLIAFLVYRSRRQEEEGLVSEEEVFPVDVEEMDGLMNDMSQDDDATPEEKERQRIKEQVEKLASQNPGDVAALLKTWIAEE